MTATWPLLNSTVASACAHASRFRIPFCEQFDIRTPPAVIFKEQLPNATLCPLTTFSVEEKPDAKTPTNQDR